jgi:hypothetical protein
MSREMWLGGAGSGEEGICGSASRAMASRSDNVENPVPDCDDDEGGDENLRILGIWGLK